MSGTVNARMFVLKRMILPLVLLCACSLVRAAGIDGQNLFEVTVRVPDESSTVQRAAFTKGLQQVLVRLSGDSRVLSKLKLPPATRYVKQFRYDVLPVPEGETALLDVAPQLQLWMQFDADKLSDLLRQNQLPVWSPLREAVVVWLAVRDGKRHYLLKRRDTSLIKKALEQAARVRGLPIVWPLYDQQDREKVRFSDVWAGFQQPILQASQRYASGAVLIGHLSWDGNTWRSEWHLLDAGKRSSHRNSNADYAAAISQAIGQMADELGKHYALLDDDSNAQQVLVEFSGVENLDDYLQVEKILQRIALVRQASVSALHQDVAVFQISLRSGIEAFITRLNRNRQLKALPAVLPTAPPAQGIAGVPAGEASSVAQTGVQPSPVMRPANTPAPAAAVPAKPATPLYRYRLRPTAGR